MKKIQYTIEQLAERVRFVRELKEMLDKKEYEFILEYQTKLENNPSFLRKFKNRIGGLWIT